MKSTPLFRIVSIALITLSFSAATPVFADQPHMNAALDHLRAARAELAAALADKGGHRDHAIALVDQAIAEVKAGKRFAR